MSTVGWYHEIVDSRNSTNRGKIQLRHMEDCEHATWTVVEPLNKLI